jgi:hypothetical protein
MRWSWLRTMLLGLLLGPAPWVTDVAEADPAEADRAMIGTRSGHAIRGENFYVWDEDPREASVRAQELGGTEGEPAHVSELRAVLRTVGPLERTWLITSWATSADESIRLMLASALAAPLDVIGGRWALEHLRSDPSAEVRRRAEAALSGTDRA